MAGISSFPFPHGKHALVLTAVLLAQAALYHTASVWEKAPTIRPLDGFPITCRNWRMLRDYPTDPSTQAVLKADDILSRAYGQTGGGAATLFVAYFKSQRAGQSPHSPKNCLPGSGFEPSASGFLDVQVPGRSKPIDINRYVVSRGDEKSVVLYWYQSHRRVIASEYAAKIWLVLDSIRYHRSDTALVRVVIPVIQNDEAGATRTGIDFIRSFFPVIEQYLTPIA